MRPRSASVGRRSGRAFTATSIIYAPCTPAPTTPGSGCLLSCPGPARRQGADRRGAAVDGHPGDQETPLITAASYGEAEVAKVLIDARAGIRHDT